jgi:hypothetical protein
MPFPLILKFVGFMLLLYGVFISISRINTHEFESSRDKIGNYIALAVYFSLFPCVSKSVDRLLSIPKDWLIGMGVALLVFPVIQWVVQSISGTLGAILEGPTEFASQKIVQALPKRLKSDPEPEEILFKEDIRIAAIHEAGHALVYGLLDTLPSSLVAYINKRALCSSEYSGVGGQVGAVSRPYSLQYEPCMKWSMFLSLAGMEGERAVLGVCSSGAQADMDHWYSKAKLYLVSGCSTLLYFPLPQEEWEVNTNRESLASLLKIHREVLTQFFKENQQVLSELADALIQRERLKANDLKPFLNKVVSVPGIPKVSDKYLRFL